MAATEFENLKFSLSLFDAMQKDNLSYVYRGFFNQQITDSILSLTEVNLQTEEQSNKMKKRVYAIMVEGLQNITRHQNDSASKSIQSTHGLFIIKRSEDKYYITTGNATEKKSIPVITELIEKINRLNKDELKVYYKQVLNEGELSDKGGAGLGLIDMARKSGNKLSYRFTDLNETDTYFYLHTIPTLTDLSKDFNKVAKDSLDNIIDIHKTLNNEDIKLIYNGVMNQESLKGLLQTIEGHLSDNKNEKNKMFYIVMEMLQNIVKHASNPNGEEGGNPGIFFISEKNGKHLLTAGNYMENTHVDEVDKKITYVNSLSVEEMNEYYNNSLFDFEIDDSKKAGLGIIDLRLKSNNKIGHYLRKINENYTFFSLQIQI